MGCVESFLRKILFLVLVAAFFVFGGYNFTQQKISEYQNPPREVFVQEEKNFGDFSMVPSDYQLTRSYNLFGYKKINAKYLPTGQKITIFDMKSEDKISPKDFPSKEIDNKLESLLNKTKDSVVTFENFEIVRRGVYRTSGIGVPYLIFRAKVKNVPFKHVVGTIAAYSTINSRAKKPSTKLVFTTVDSKAYNSTIVQNLIQAVSFR